MNQALKQRLVGALVLAALAVIFLPSLFNGGRPKPVDVMQGIAPMPTAVPPLAVEEPVHPQGLPPEEPGKADAKDMFALDTADTKIPEAPAETAAPDAVTPVSTAEKTPDKPAETSVAAAAPAPVEAVSHAVPPASDPPVLKSNGLPQAWALQVGVFSDKAKATALKNTLQAKGYRAFTRTQIHDNKSVTRVLIGPEVQASAIAKTKAKVDKLLSIKSMVVKFES